MSTESRFSFSKHSYLGVCLPLLLGACGGVAPDADNAEEVGAQSQAIRVSSQLDCPNGVQGPCTVPNMPSLGQESDLIDADITQGTKAYGCYDTSIASVIATSLANRTTSQALTGRSLVLDTMKPGDNGKTPPAATPKSYEQLSQVYRSNQHYHDLHDHNLPYAIADEPTYFKWILNEFTGTQMTYPGGCDPRHFDGGVTCNFMTLAGNDFAGATFRDWMNDSTNTSNDYVKNLMKKGFAVMVGYQRYRPATTPQATCSGYVFDSMHKVAIGGYQDGPYPLLLNDVGDGKQYKATISDDLSALGIQDFVTIPDAKAETCVSGLPTSSRWYLHYDPATAPTEKVFFLTQIDALSLGLDSSKGVNQVFSGNWGSGWTTLMPFTLNGQPSQLAYNTNTGAVHFDQFYGNANGVLTKWSYTWGTGFSHFVPYTINGYPYFIAYNKTNGTIHFDTFPSDLQGPVINLMSTMTPGFSSVMPFTIKSTNYVLFYNKDTGEVRFYRINSRGSGYAQVWSGTWGTGLTDFIPQLTKDHAYYVAYNATNGNVELDQIADNLQGSSPKAAFLGTKNRKLLGLAQNGPANFMWYMPSSGFASVERSTKTFSDYGNLWQTNVMTSATTLSSFEQDGKSYALLYDAASGNVRSYSVATF